MRRRGGIIGHTVLKSLGRGRRRGGNMEQYRIQNPNPFTKEARYRIPMSKMFGTPGDKSARGIAAPYMGNGRRRRGRGFWSSLGSLASNVGSKLGTAAQWVANNPQKIFGAIDTGLNIANTASQKVQDVKNTINAIKQQHSSQPPKAEPDNMNGKPPRGRPRPRPQRPRRAQGVSKNKAYNKIMGGYLRGPIP